MDPKAQNDKHFGWNYDIMHHQAKKSHSNGGFMSKNTNLTRTRGKIEVWGPPKHLSMGLMIHHVEYFRYFWYYGQKGPSKAIIGGV